MSRVPRWLVLAAVPMALTLVATGCSKSKGGVAATVDEWKIALGSSSAPAGDVTFDISNEGTKVHEFVVFKTDLAEDALPTITEAGEIIIDEEGEGLEAVDEVEDIAPGSGGSLTVNLAAGTYVVVCNRPGHYDQGMHATFTVSS